MNYRIGDMIAMSDSYHHHFSVFLPFNEVSIVSLFLDTSIQWKCPKTERRCSESPTKELATLTQDSLSMCSL